MTATEKKIVVLFDEFGLPIFKMNSTGNYFLGVAALYELSDEDKIYNAVGKLMGFYKSKPLKNNNINKLKAVEIAKNVSKQNIYVTAKWLDLNNATLAHYTEIYTKLSNISREIYRNVGERKDVHFLHNQLLDSCLFDIISRFVEVNVEGIYRFKIYIDNWSYPTTDTHIVLEFIPESLQKHIQRYINDDLNSKSEVLIETIEFFRSQNSKRERFIDVLTSIISRSYVDQNSSKFDLQPVNELRMGLGEKFVLEDITIETIQFINEQIHRDIEMTKVKERPLIIT